MSGQHDVEEKSGLPMTALEPIHFFSIQHGRVELGRPGAILGPLEDEKEKEKDDKNKETAMDKYRKRGKLFGALTSSEAQPFIEEADKAKEKREEAKKRLLDSFDKK